MRCKSLRDNVINDRAGSRIDDYDGDEVSANVCEPHIGGVPDRCERLSTTNPLFATTVRKAYPGQSPGDGR